MACSLIQNKGYFAKEINAVGPKLFKLSRKMFSEPLPKIGDKQLFPRSIVFELDYVKAVNKRAMIEALEKERIMLEKSIDEKEKQLNIPERINYTKHKYDERVKEIKEDRKNDSDRDVTDKCVSVCGPCGCVLTRGVSHKYAQRAVNESNCKQDDQCIIWPKNKPKFGQPWNQEREVELLRVGYPFAREAASWLHCTIHPFDTSQMYKPSKKKFPERCFSSLNI